MENVLTLGTLLSLWFCFLLHSFLILISQTSYHTYKISSSYELSRPVMGTIFLVTPTLLLFSTPSPLNNIDICSCKAGLYRQVVKWFQKNSYTENKLCDKPGKTIKSACSSDMQNSDEKEAVEAHMSELITKLKKKHFHKDKVTGLCSHLPSPPIEMKAS